jgi:hypothetical protein
MAFLGSSSKHLFNLYQDLYFIFQIYSCLRAVSIKIVVRPSVRASVITKEFRNLSMDWFETQGWGILDPLQFRAQWDKYQTLHMNTKCISVSNTNPHKLTNSPLKNNRKLSHECSRTASKRNFTSFIFVYWSLKHKFQASFCICMTHCCSNGKKNRCV